MRLPVFALVLLLGACGSQPEPSASRATDTMPPAATGAPAPTPTPTVADATTGAATAAVSRKLLDAYLDALNSHDADRAASLLHDDAVMFDALQGSLTQTRAEARDKVIGMYLRALPDGRWTLRGEPVLSDSGFSYEWALGGVNLGDFTTYLRGKGQKIDFKGVTIVRVRDGKIVYLANYFDPSVLAAQAGW